MDHGLLNKLQAYIKALKYPFSAVEREICHTMARSVVTNDLYGFKVCCKLSTSNKRILCTLNLNKLCELFTI